MPKSQKVASVSHIIARTENALEQMDDCAEFILGREGMSGNRVVIRTTTQHTNNPLQCFYHKHITITKHFTNRKKQRASDTYITTRTYYCFDLAFSE